MALYKNQEYLAHYDHPAFDRVYQPGEVLEHSGIYRCTGCNREILGEKNKPLPPQDHHQHSPSQGQFLWKLVVYADCGS